MAIIQQMFPVSADGSYWFSEYRPTTNTQNNNGDYSYYNITVSLDDAGFIYTTGTYLQHGTGYQGRFGKESYLHMTKYTPSGDVVFLKRRQHMDGWEVSYDNSTFNTNGDFLVAASGNTKNSSGGTAQYDGLLFKWDKDGNYGWHRSLGNNSTDNEYDTFETIGVDSSSNIYVAGEGSYQNDLYENGSCTYHTSWLGSRLLAKYNSSGTLQWKKEIRKGTGCHSNSHYNCWDFDIAVTPAGNIYGAGRLQKAHWPTQNNAPECGYSGQAFVMKLNSSGSIQWQRRLRANHTISKGGSWDGCWARIQLRAMGIDSNENLYACGENWCTSSPSFGTYANYGAMLVKYNSSGTIQWQRNWHRPSGSTGGTGVALTKGVQFDADDNVYLCIRYTNDNPIIIHKWNSSGTHQWTRSIKRNNTDTSSSGDRAYPQDFKIDKVRKTMVICGYFQPSGSNRYRAYLLKLPIDGSHTGTYGNWVYSNYSSQWTHSNTFAGNNITANDTSGVLDIYSSSMVERQSYNSYDAESDHPLEITSYNNA